MQNDLGHAPSELLVQFKQLLFLPGKVAVRFQKTGKGLEFALLARNSFLGSFLPDDVVAAHLATLDAYVGANR